MRKTTPKPIYSSDLQHVPNNDSTTSVIPSRQAKIQKTSIPSATKQLLSQRSIDIKLRDALKPPINDRSVFKPERYYSMLADTQAAVLKQIQNAKTEEAKEALNALNKLLEENVMLRSILDQYMNHIKKA